MESKTPEKLLKPYNPAETEGRIYQAWEGSGYFNPDVCIEKGITKSDAEPFSIVLPPPNVTGTLHTGHAFMLVIQDIMIRYQRMQGKKTLWLPGTDHAAIATQSKVEKLLEKDGIKKKDLGREAFLDRVNQFAQESHDTIVGQVRKMGSSIDWSREAFTLDAARNTAVNTAFKKMYEDDLIYRGDRMVNWDPKGQTVISDDELVYKEEKTKFYYLKYGPFTIGTARPETKFGDKYVVMHPDDARYAKYNHGDKLELEWINGPLTATIIKDPMIDMEFGTGVMTITPWHSQADFDLAEKYKLDKEQIIDTYGKLLPIAGEFAGMKIKDAREKIIEKLAAKGLVEKIEDYTHNVATAERSEAVVEPQIMRQWFIDVNKPIPYRENKSLKELMIDAVRGGDIQILPDRSEKVYFHWIENLRDWCISRQIWYGHRIPVWYDKDNNPHLAKDKKIILVRHGESEGNVKKVWSGHQDSPLTKKGYDQALETAKLLQPEKITKIISSDLSRAYETAKTIKEHLDLDCEIETWQDLREVDPGEFTDQQTDGTPIMVKAFESKKGENYEKLISRVEKVLGEIKKIETDGTILIVSHNSFLAALSSVLEGRSKKEDLVAMRKSRPLYNAQARTFTIQIPPNGLEQDPDTLDTWFSSGLWTFSTLGWPNQTEDLTTYHPTSVLETGNDILFFWVARMILMSTYLLDEIPFKTVYLHGMVRDEKGRKMSKSLGNIVDPVDLINKYGADALRMAMIIGVGPGSDNNLGEDKIKAYSKFANKIWNATRFVVENTAGFDLSTKPELETDHQNFITMWYELTKEITPEMEEYKFYLVSEKLYHFFWHTFADVVIEKCKTNLNDSAKYTLLYLLTEQLKALHPFMPFVTEELWSLIPHRSQDENSAGHSATNARELLMIESWPASN